MKTAAITLALAAVLVQNIHAGTTLNREESYLVQGAKLVGHWAFSGQYPDILGFQGPATANPYLAVRVPDYVNIPAVNISTGPFSFALDIRVQPSSNRQIVLANWVSGQWQFISTVTSGKFTVTLRRNIYTAGSDPEQDLISVTSKDPIPTNTWTTVTFTWSPSQRRARLYFDTNLQDDQTVRASVTDVTVKVSNAQYYRIGVKEDDGLSGQLNADLGNVFFYQTALPAPGCVTFDASYAASLVTTDSLLAFFPFNGDFRNLVNPSAPATGNSQLVTNDGTPYVSIRSPGYVNIPAVPITTGPWTIDFEIRAQPSNSRQIVFANWNSGMWQFISTIQNSKFSLTLRRNIYTAGSDPQQDLISVTSADTVPLQQWIRITAKWTPSARRLQLYFNTKLQDDQTVRSTVTDVTIKGSSAPFSRLGVKDDDGLSGQLNADIRNFRIFGSARDPLACECVLK